MPDNPLQTVVDDFAAELDELSALVAGGTDLDLATPAAGWSIRDTISHLSGVDAELLLALRDPERFVAEAPGKRGNPAFVAGHLDAGRALGAQLLSTWRRRARAVLWTVAECPPQTRVPWFGPAMSLRSAVTARIMEYWAHGQDIVDALGVDRVPTDRLRHVAHLGVITRGWSYQVHGRPPPTDRVRVELVGPAGQAWIWGPPEQPPDITGPAVEFCLRVTRRRHLADLPGLRLHTPAAREWMAIAQCYAGPPGADRPPGMVTRWRQEPR